MNITQIDPMAEVERTRAEVMRLLTLGEEVELERQNRWGTRRALRMPIRRTMKRPLAVANDIAND